MIENVMYNNAFCNGSNKKNKPKKMQRRVKPNLKTCVDIEADLKADAGSKAKQTQANASKADASKADADHKNHEPIVSKIIAIANMIA